MTLLKLQSIFPGTEVTDSIAAARQSTVKELSTDSIDDLLSKLTNNLAEFAIHLAVAILVFYVGKFIITKLYNVVASIMLRRKVDRSLSTFVLSLTRIVLYFILIVTVIGILGIETSSFIAIFASAGVAIGMALSGTLQNFAGGVLILLLKPYRIGDYIEAQGYAGTVTEIQIFNTIICTPDNKSIIIPNGGLSTGSINNWSREQYRRVDWSVGISYGDSVETARRAILAIIEEDHRIVRHYVEEDTPEPATDEEAAAETGGKKQRRTWIGRLLRRSRNHMAESMAAADESADGHIKSLKPKLDCSPKVYVTELADSSVNLSVRAWCRSADYWPIYFEILEKIYARLPESGVSFPFPQLDVHVNQ